jgi:hypothetical protein
MPRGQFQFGGFARPEGVTLWSLVTLLSTSLLWAFAVRWAGVSDEIARAPFFVPYDLLHWQLWRLVTYPCLMPPSDGASMLIALFFTAWAIVIFMPPLEMAWGRRRLLLRLVMFAVVPALLVFLLSFPVSGLRGQPFVGPGSIIFCLIVAFATETGGPITLFPLPFTFAGDGLLWLEAGVLAMMIIFDGTIFPHMLNVVSFAFALVWFRLNVVRDLRRSWLRLRKRRIEAHMARLRRERSLRIVSPDDDDEEPRRLLH